MHPRTDRSVDSSTPRPIRRDRIEKHTTRHQKFTTTPAESNRSGTPCTITNHTPHRHRVQEAHASIKIGQRRPRCVLLSPTNCFLIRRRPSSVFGREKKNSKRKKKTTERIRRKRSDKKSEIIELLTGEVCRKNCESLSIRWSGFDFLPVLIWIFLRGVNWIGCFTVALCTDFDLRSLSWAVFDEVDRWIDISLSLFETVSKFWSIFYVSFSYINFELITFRSLCIL